MTPKAKRLIIMVLIAFGFFLGGMVYGSYTASKWLISVAFNFFEIELDEDEFYTMITNYKRHINKCYIDTDERG